MTLNQISRIEEGFWYIKQNWQRHKEEARVSDQRVESSLEEGFNVECNMDSDILQGFKPILLYPFLQCFIQFCTMCGVIYGVISYGVMKFTNFDSENSNPTFTRMH